MKKLTREERRKRSQRRLMYITYALFLLLLLAWLGSYLVMTVEAESAAQYKAEIVRDNGSLPGDDTTALVRCYLTEEEREEAENALIEAALLARSHKIEDVTVTHYCTCSRCCGKSDGITASGRMATPGVSVAVDPSIIPLGSDVLVDYDGDGEMHYMRADDVGGAIKGAHIDVCVKDHQTAISEGVKTATVYWISPEAFK